MTTTLTQQQIEQDHAANLLAWMRLEDTDLTMEDPDEYRTDEQIAAELLDLTGGF